MDFKCGVSRQVGLRRVVFLLCRHCFAVVFPMFDCWMPAVALSCYWIIFVYRYFDLGVGNDVGVDNKKSCGFHTETAANKYNLLGLIIQVC